MQIAKRQIKQKYRKLDKPVGSVYDNLRFQFPNKYIFSFEYTFLYTFV